jgi:uncharacterized membrane protein YiaA
MTNIAAWVVALFHSWLLYVVGAPFVLLGIVEKLTDRTLLKGRYYLAAIAVAFFAANFGVWAAQKSAADAATAGEQTAQEQVGDLQAQVGDLQTQVGDLQTQLNDQKAYNSPNLQVSIQNVWLFPQGKNLELYMVVDVRNTGADSIVDYWEVYIANRSHRKGYLLSLHRIDVPFSFPTIAGRMIYKPSYWLPDRTLPDPVRRGGDRKGILICIVPGLPLKDLDPNSIGITFNDVSGNTHWAMNVRYQVNTGAVSPPTLDR